MWWGGGWYLLEEGGWDGVGVVGVGGGVGKGGVKDWREGDGDEG